ncbi:MAG: hypothetical protein IT363_00350 [Methanoregulaceae archaeon]|nr:hypothetical protein [Methanoregulaceae archaeon]
MNVSDQQRIGFTSDLHLYHAKIIRLQNRPFASVLGMNEAMRDAHNRLFDRDSIVFNLGDALLLPRDCPALVERQALDLLRSFNGKICYLPGNHERQLDLISQVWTVLEPLVDLYVERGSDTQHIVLCHYPLRSWNGAAQRSWHLHGHSHGSLRDDHGRLMRVGRKRKMLDVGVDANFLVPLTLDGVEMRMAERMFVSNDHHDLLGRLTNDQASGAQLWDQPLR